MKYTVFLESEEFGLEMFGCEEFHEALTKIERLYYDAKNQQKEDGITRRVGLLIEPTERRDRHGNAGQGN